MVLREELVGSHGRWKRPCLQTALMRATSDVITTVCWRRLDHPHIVGFKAASVHPPHLCIVQEFCSRGSLDDLLHIEFKRTRHGLRLAQLLYVQALAHISNGKRHFTHSLTPAQGMRRGGGLGIGAMENDSLVASGLPNVAQELRFRGGTQMVPICLVCRNGSYNCYCGEASSLAPVRLPRGMVTLDLGSTLAEQVHHQADQRGDVVPAPHHRAQGPQARQRAAHLLWGQGACPTRVGCTPRVGSIRR
jgi:hypothetical protein